MKEYDVKISVIMPTYNRAEIIPRSIRSVLRQTMPDFELFIIDDASTDETEAVVRGFEDARIRYIKRTVNHLEHYKETGESDNPRNDGLKQARGQYISYLDSDDIYRSNFLEVMSDYLDRNPDVGMAYCDAYWHRHLKGEDEMDTCNLSVDFGPKIMTIRNIIRTPTVMHRYEVYEKTGFFSPVWVKVPHPGVPYVGIEDWDYWFRISKQFKVKHYAVPLAHKINKTSDYYDDPEFDPEFKKKEAAPKEKPEESKDLFYRIKLIDQYQGLVEKTADIEGYLKPSEGYALMMLAAGGSGRGEIVEIGSFLGRSTCWLAMGSKAAEREKVTAIDHFKGSKEHQSGKKFECSVLVEEGTTFNRFRENLKAVEVEDHVRPIRAASEDAVVGWTEPVRLLFIDGDHDYESTKKDFELWSKFVTPGGYICFHDVETTWPGVTQFYHELINDSDEYVQAASTGSLRVVRKKK